jgi:hypothetical protein
MKANTPGTPTTEPFLQGKRRMAWITALDATSVHVVFPFTQPYYDTLCFI